MASAFDLTNVPVGFRQREDGYGQHEHIDSCIELSGTLSTSLLHTRHRLLPYHGTLAICLTNFSLSYT